MEINLVEEIKSLRGIPYINPDGSAMTVKDALLEQIGSYRAKTGAETVKVYALGQKVLAAGDSMQLIDEEAKLLKSTFDQAHLPVAVAGFVLAMLG